MSDYLYTGTEWNTDTLSRIYEECEIIGKEELRLEWYPNIFHIVGFEAMLDVYASVGMPKMYQHWSYGKTYAQNFEAYRKGHMGLALEMVINTNPCINYLLDENTATGQALVIGHAAIGHNSFFKDNYLFKQWTQADSINDYISFAKKYIEDCEEKYGVDEVEEILDCAHALMDYGVDRYHKPKILSKEQEKQRQKERLEHQEKAQDEMWSLIPSKHKITRMPTRSDGFLPRGPEENLLYFLEKKSPILMDWQREILRIVRKISQYFSPQAQTKTANEGWASTVHYYIMNRLYDKGLINDGGMMEFLNLHTAVVRQEPFHSKYYNGFNPYHMGFSIFEDIRRMSENPTDEDKEWFPDIAGGDFVDNWKYAFMEFRDDSFIQQFMSPKVMRDMKLFSFSSDEDEDEYLVTDVHNDRGYRNVRNTLSEQHSIGNRLPDIQVTSVDFDSRECFLTHHSNNYVSLKEDEASRTLAYFRRLWGFGVTMNSRDRKDNSLIATYK